MRTAWLILLVASFARPVCAQEASATDGEDNSPERAQELLRRAEDAEAAGDGGLALEALERFLEAFPYDPRASGIVQRLAALRKAKTRVRIESPNAEASVWIDDTKLADRTPAEIVLPEGRHRVVVTARDGRSSEVELVLPPASRRVVEVTFAGDFDPLEQARFGVGGAVDVEAPKEPEADPREEARKRRRVVALAGVSSAALVLTGVFGMTALADDEEFRRAPSESVARRGERFAMLADVSLGVAIAAGVSALVLKLKNREKKPESVSLRPALVRRGVALVVGGAL
jgi:hypothetical protein